MNEVERYIRDVLRNIQAPPQERQRIEADLRAHLQEALSNLPSGESPAAVIARMGSPAEVAAEFMAGVTLRYAGFWPRLAAFAVDIALCVVVALPLAFLAIFLGSRVSQTPHGLDYAIGAVLIVLTLSLALGMVSLFLLYFPVLEGRFGQTVGKRLLKLRVIQETGAPIGYKEALLRRLSFYFDILALDALFVPFTAKRQRAFDIVARTVVVRE